MALVWSHEEDGSRYEVRSAGASLRLYRNGVNHSQWNPNRPLSGSIWDLITLPALHRPTGSLNSALMLGFGAGAVARQLCNLAEVKHLVLNTIEPDKINHLPLLRSEKMDKRLQFSLGYQIDGYENRVLAFSDKPFSQESLKTALLAICRRYPRCYGVAKRYRQIKI